MTACPKCHRPIAIETIDGVRVAIEPDVITVTPFERTPPIKIAARRVHGELCVRYQLENEKTRALQKRRGFNERNQRRARRA